MISVGAPPAFLGHIGGDDFVIICTPEQVRPLTEAAVTDFERAADTLYDPDDARRGYVELPDRRGNVRRAALVTLSIGVALSVAERRLTDPVEAIEVASRDEVAGQEPARLVRGDGPPPHRTVN